MIKRHSILQDLILTILTLGIYNIWIQFRQIEDVNNSIKDADYSLIKTIILSLITFGIYFSYHEYSLTYDLHNKVYGEKNSPNSWWVFPASLFGLWFFVDSYQQALINAVVDEKDHISEKDKNHLYISIPLIIIFVTGIIYS